MDNWVYKDTEKELHDYILAESIERKKRLQELLSKKLGIPNAHLDSEAVMAKILLPLVQEESSITADMEEDIWIFLSQWQEDSENEAIEASRVSGKNSHYNRDKAKQYIDAHWQNYNPAYPTFHGGGGDCANFVSQVLYAGGMQWVDDGSPNHYSWASNWYCKPGATNKDGDRRITLSWKVAAAFKRHWEKRTARNLVISYQDAIRDIRSLSSQVHIGDPVQFCYANGISYHTLVVTGYAWDRDGGFNDIVLASHTIDSNRRSLYHTMLLYPSDYQLRVYVIKDGA